jgi:aspartate carbamoyltransferase
MASRFLGRHIITAKQFTREDLHQIFQHALEMRRIVTTEGATSLLHGKMLALIFYEASSRTLGSFDAAAKRLGAETIIPSPGMHYSSVIKGENLSDTVRTFEALSDALVLRHPKRGSAAEAARVLRKPLLNAGDGDGEHPTQALLDLFTIFLRRGAIDGLTFVMAGDLRYGRTIHALFYLLRHYRVKIHLVAPEPLGLTLDHWKEFHGLGLDLTEYQTLGSAMGCADVLYVTRVQKERFPDRPELFEQVRGSYVVTPALLDQAKDDLVLMHPFPRNDEIAPEVDQDPRAAYFEQIENGLYVRMALLGLVLGKI